jgi:MFS family permease
VEAASAEPAVTAAALPHPGGVALPVQRRLMATLFTAQSISNAAQVVAFTSMPWAAVFLTGSEVYAGVPATITLAGRALIAYPIGWLMDRLGRRLGIALGLSMSIVGAFLCAWALLAGSFALFCTGALINGFGRGTGEQSRYAAADIVPPERASSAIGTLVFAGTIGAVLGPLLIAPAQRAAGARGLAELSGPYLLTAAFSFVAFALIFVFLRPDPVTLRQRRDDAHAAAATVPARPARTLREVFAVPAVQFAVLALAISQLVMTMIMIITPLHMTHEAHSTDAVAWVIMAHNLGMFGLASVTGWLTARAGPYAMVLAGALVLALAAVLAPITHSVAGLAMALFLLGLGWSFAFVAGSALLVEAVDGSERGATQGASETLVAVAAAAGSFSTGPAFQWGGYVAVAMVGLALALALVAAQFWARRSARIAPARA